MSIGLGGGSMRLISGFDILDEWGVDLANGGTVATEWSEDLLTREIDFIKGSPPQGFVEKQKEWYEGLLTRLTTPQKQPQTQMTDEPTEELNRFFDSMVVRKD